jgi:hypothetical protein
MHRPTACVPTCARSLGPIPSHHCPQKAGPFCKKHRLGTEHLLDKAGRSRKPPMEMTHICWIEAKCHETSCKTRAIAPGYGGGPTGPLFKQVSGTRILKPLTVWTAWTVSEPKFSRSSKSPEGKDSGMPGKWWL